MQMRIVESSVEVSAFERRLLFSLLLAHAKVLQLSLAVAGRALSEAEAEPLVIEGVREYAAEAFPELTLEVLPGFGPN